MTIWMNANFLSSYYLSLYSISNKQCIGLCEVLGSTNQASGLPRLTGEACEEVTVQGRALWTLRLVFGKSRKW